MHPFNPKNQSSNTSVIASTLMQKMMLHHHGLNLNQSQLNQSQLIQNDSKIYPNKVKIKNKQTSQQQTNNHEKNDQIFDIYLPQSHKQLKINLQYEPEENRNQKKQTMMKLMKSTKYKILKHKIENSDQVDKKQSKINKILKNYKYISSIQNINPSVIRNQYRQNEQLLNQEELNQLNKIQDDISPKKVTVNFELFFPRSKIKSTSHNNKQSNSNTRRSINLTSLERSSNQIFRIKSTSKKSSKQLNINAQNEGSYSSPLKKSNSKLLSAISKSSAQKYIQKIQKYKKYKNSKISKQLKFGLNVLPAEYHQIQIRANNGIKTSISRDYPLTYNENIRLASGTQITTNTLDQAEYQNQINLQRSQYQRQGKLISLYQYQQMTNHRKNMIQQQNISKQGRLIKQSYSQSKQTHKIKQSNSMIKSSKTDEIDTTISYQKKCPSEQKLLKNVILLNELQRKRNMYKTTKINFNNSNVVDYREKGSVKIKLANMLNSLDQVLNAYCCKFVLNNQEIKGNLQKQQIKFFGDDVSTINIQSPILVDLSKGNDQTKIISQNLTIPTLKSKKSYFYYYVGPGNNRNLIRSMMKKRFWWAETDNIDQAHFVWSQLKIKQVLEKQFKLSDNKIQQPDSWNFKIRQNEQDQNQSLSMIDSKQLTNSKQKAIHKKKKNFQLSQQQQYYLLQQSYYHRIFHKNMKSIYLKKLHEKSLEYKYLRTIATPYGIHNHYDANYMVGNKKALFINLTEYQQYMKTKESSLNIYDFIPATFQIQKTNSKEYKNFLKVAKKSKNALWIVKPGQNSNRGNGIFVEKNIEKIKSHIQKNCEKHSFIVQKYLKSIFLYNRRKFDIRAYMLMATIGGITKFFWYQEGYLRTSSEIYNTQDISDIFIHLTNDAIQSKNDTYSKYQKGNKISFTEFQRYLDSNYPEQKYSVKDMAEKMRQITQHVVKATYFKLDKAKKINGFQLFGLDFLIDSNFQPWLLEVNTNPCLELSSPVLERLIPRMIENMLRITVDPLFRPCEQQHISRHLSHLLYENVFQTNKFHLIFDSLFDSNFEWEQICLKERMVVYKDDDELFDDNGEQLAEYNEG